MEYVLETNNLEKKYKDFKALSNASIHVEKGAIYGLIGKNGAGKTTLIRVVCGLQQPSNGSYSIYGESNESSTILEARRRVGAIIEKPAIYLDMTARDNLIEQYKLVGMPVFDGGDELLSLVGLENTGKKKVKDFSLGMKQRLGIALSLVSFPDFLILDEPINGLDPQGIVEIRELILRLKKERGMTILISSHYLDELSKIATHYGFLDNGSIIKEISSDELVKKLQHKIIIKTSNQKEFVKYFEENKISYEVEDNITINVYGQYNLSILISELNKRNLMPDTIKEQEESLENYYMNLIGGGKNA